jgi:hypothetical protein
MDRAFVLALAVAVSGCATSYVPIPGRRVSIVLEGGNPKLSKGGRTYGIGFGGGLVEAVGDHPEAERHAVAFRNGQITTFALIGGALASVLVGGALAFVYTGANNNGSPALAYGGIAGLTVALGLDIAALIVSANTQPHLYDAINIYNDAVDPPHAPFPPPPPPTPTNP